LKKTRQNPNTIYFGISFSSLLHIALVNPVIYLYCATLVDPVEGGEITTIDIRVRST